jgi:hypothetical protein
MVSVFMSGCGSSSSTTPSSDPSNPVTTADPNPLPAGWVRLYDFSTGNHGWNGVIQKLADYSTTQVNATFDNTTGYLGATFSNIVDANTQKISLENGGTVADLSAYKKLQVKVKHTAGANFKEVAFAIMETGYSHWNGDSRTTLSADGETLTIDLTNGNSGDLKNVIYIGVECKSADGASGSGSVYISSINAEPK